ncbi:MAG: glycoside hydrolase family 88 protein [Acidobacteriota bacterium]
MLTTRRQCFEASVFAALCLLLPVTAQATERRVIGLAADGKTRIEALVKDGYTGLGGEVWIQGLEGEDGNSQGVIAEFEKSPAVMVVIPIANPLKSTLKFPPSGLAYHDNTESWVLWNWLTLHAPERVRITIDARSSGSEMFRSLILSLPKQLHGSNGLVVSSLAATADIFGPAEAFKARLARTPRQLADELAQVYGHDFNQLTYLPGMALIGQIRLGATADVATLAKPYLTQGRDLLSRASSLTLAGHLVFAELARRTGDKRYTDLVKKAADLGFTPDGRMQESMPFHGEMSDSYFMAGPITAMAGRLTGQRKYFDMVARHFRFMDALVLRDDGLYRHSPLNNAAWGRANAFPALGITLALSEFPEDHPDRKYILDSYRALMARLKPFQDADGMWHEIIDNPGSYQELSATMMIATCMQRGIRRGWIDAKEYQPYVDRAWKATLIRVGSDGSLIDVAESTNKQPTYEDYLNRTAISGKDERGGGMALFFATEMAGLQ